jgi:tetratricopeptide (TPR) repeat protein
MPQSGDFEGLGDAKTAVKPVPGTDFASTPLTAQEGFVLSRVDGSLPLGMLCQITGLGQKATCDILRRLAELGLIQLGDQPPPSKPAPRAETPQEGRPRRDTPTDTQIPAEMAARAMAIQAQAEVEPERKRKAEQWTPPRGVPLIAAPADEPEVELKEEARTAIRTLQGHLQDMNFFQLLDVDPNADTTTIRRAYFKRSKEFHPDRYFRKQIGPYKAMLDEIFKQVSAAYHFLEDEPQRKAYREMVNQEANDAAQLAQVEAQGAQARADEAAEQGGEATPEPEAAAESGSTPAEPRPPRRSRTGTRPKFPWEVGRTPTGPGFPPFKPPTPAAPTPTPTLSAQELKAREERREADRERRLRALTTPFKAQTRPLQAQKFYEQGMRQLQAGEVMAATASLKLALSFGSEDPDVQKAYDEASEKSRSQTAENYFKRGVFEESVGRLDNANKYFLQAADTLPKAAYLHKAATVMIGAGDLIKARDYATKAVQNDPNSVDARIALAKVFEETGMKKNARRELEEALKLDPGNTVAKERLRAIKWG